MRLLSQKLTWYHVCLYACVLTMISISHFFTIFTIFTISLVDRVSWLRCRNAIFRFHFSSCILMCVALAQGICMKVRPKRTDERANARDTQWPNDLWLCMCSAFTNSEHVQQKMGSKIAYYLKITEEQRIERKY